MYCTTFCIFSPLFSQNFFFNFRAKGIKPIETKKPVPKQEMKKSTSDIKELEKPEETAEKKPSKFKVKVMRQNVAEDFVAGVINLRFFL